MAVDSACPNYVSSLKFVGDTLSISALIGLVTLTFDLLILKLVRNKSRGIGNFPTNFYVFSNVSLSAYLPETPNTSQTYHLVTFTFDLGGHGACQ